MLLQPSHVILAMMALTCSCQDLRAEVRIEKDIGPGKPFLLSDGTTYDAGERFRVNEQHRIPDDMVVQGDTVVLKAVADGLEGATGVSWSIVRGWGKPKLTVDAADSRTARFVADGYGVNKIAFEATVDGQRVSQHTQVFVEFSTDNSFSQANEDALAETIDGDKLILMARPRGTRHNRRFESTDDGKTWTAKQDTTLPTAVVNFGLDKVVEPGTPEHGRVVYSAAAARKGSHKSRDGTPSE